MEHKCTKFNKNIDYVCSTENNCLILGVNGEYSVEVNFCPFCGFQPERSKREDSSLLENDGRIKILCQRFGCRTTLLIREYSKNKGTHFCPACWIQLCSVRNFIIEQARLNKKEPTSVTELDKIIIDQFIKYGEMRCSELWR